MNNLAQGKTVGNIMLKYATYYMKNLGFSVIPVNPRDKKPLIPWEEYQSRKATAEEITQWWQKWPNANIGIITGAVSGIIVLDVDGEEGQRSIKDNKLSLPPTWAARTGGGGFHYFFKHPGNSVCNFVKRLPGIDLRGDGGYIVAPPSIHPSGNRYQWVISPKDEELAEPPDWLLELIQTTSTGKLDPEDWQRDIPEGQRNEELTRRAGSLLSRGIPPAEALTMLLAWNQKHCKPPLPEREVKTIVESIARREMEKINSEFVIRTMHEEKNDEMEKFSSEFVIRNSINKNSSSSLWPEPLAPEAFYGLAGDFVKTIEPHTEADPAALLFTFLTMYGNVIGRNAYFVAEADKHYTNLFTCLVGASAKGRKGVSFGQAYKLFDAVDEAWAKERITQGLSSGEGLIWAVRDEQRKIEVGKKTGEEKEMVIVDGIKDKRLLVVEQEFASAIRVLKREGNTLSAVIRKAWDDGSLNVLTKNNHAQATNAHISIIAHITKAELLRYLEATEAANGFGNRFLWVCVKRSKCLPEGGRLHEVDFAPLLRRLKDAVEFGRAAGELKRDEEARELWYEVYPELSEGKPGLFGAMIARAEAQVMRLASIYALLDQSSYIRLEHLQAALACWDYVEASARFIFGDSLGDPTADEILRALKEAGEQGMTRTEIINLFGRNKNAREISKALSQLAESGIAYCKNITNENNRRVEIWFKT